MGGGGWMDGWKKERGEERKGKERNASIVGLTESRSVQGPRSMGPALFPSSSTTREEPSFL